MRTILLACVAVLTALAPHSSPAPDVAEARKQPQHYAVSVQIHEVRPHDHQAYVFPTIVVAEGRQAKVSVEGEVVEGGSDKETTFTEVGQSVRVRVIGKEGGKILADVSVARSEPEEFSQKGAVTRLKAWRFHSRVEAEPGSYTNFRVDSSDSGAPRTWVDVRIDEVIPPPLSKK